jgi:hypothetical protein
MLTNTLRFWRPRSSNNPRGEEKLKNVISSYINVSVVNS